MAAVRTNFTSSDSAPGSCPWTGQSPRFLNRNQSRWSATFLVIVTHVYLERQIWKRDFLALHLIVSLFVTSEMETSPMFQSSPASPKQLWGGSYFSTSTCSLLAAGDCLNSCTKLVSFVQVPKISFRGNLSTFIKICPFILQQWPLWRVSLYFPVSASFPLSNFLFSLKWGGCLIFSCNGNYSMELDHVHALQRQRRLWKMLVPSWNSVRTGWVFGACWL